LRVPARHGRAFEIGIRIVADAVMVNAALLVSLNLRFFWDLLVQSHAVVSATARFYDYLDIYLQWFWLLTPVCLVVFYLSGFYTRGRTYRSRYKALIVAQAVVLAYLIVIAVGFLLSGGTSIPRSILLVALVISLLFLTGSRVWSSLWRALFRIESRLGHRPPDKGIDSILVIGGAGYIGSSLVPKLLSRGYRVRLLDLFLYGQEPIEAFIDHPNLEIMRADFRQVDKVVEAVQDMDAVIHLGAIVGDPACALDSDLTIEVNLMATRMIADVAKGSGVRRFVFASTCSVYGASDQLMDEHSAAKPVSLYARSKLASEQVLMQVSNGDFAPVILRFATVYGLSGRVRFDLVVNLLTAKAVAEGKITLYGGDQWRPFVHVDDAATAIVSAVEAPPEAVENRVFNVGADTHNYTLQQVGEMIQDLVPSTELVDTGTDGDRRNYRVCFRRIREALGFQPHWSLEQGITQVIEAMRNGRVRDYRDARYSNYKFLSEEGASLLGHQNGWADKLINDESVAVEAEMN